MNSKILIRSLLLLSFVGLTLLSYQCIETPLSPVVPMTDIQMSIPLIDRTFDLTNIRDTILHTKPDGALTMFEFDTTFVNKPLDLPELKVQGANASQRASMPPFQVDGPSLPPTPFTAAQLIPGYDPSLPIPSDSDRTTTISIPIQFDNSASLEYVSIQRGDLTLKIDNTLPLQVAFPNPIQLRNDDPLDNSIVASFAFTTVIDSITGTDSKVAVLDGKFMRGKMKIDPITVTFKKRTQPFVYVLQNQGLTFTLTSSPKLDCDSARARIPKQNLLSQNNQLMKIDDSVMVEYAGFSKGTFRFELENKTDVSVKVFLKIDNFHYRKISGEPSYRIDTLIQRKTITPFTIDLSQMYLRSATQATMGTNILFDVGIEEIGSGDSTATVSQNDYVEGRMIVTEPFYLDTLRGKIKPTYMALDEAMGGLAIGDMSRLKGLMTFDSVSIQVKLNVTGGFSTDYTLKVQAKNTKSNFTRNLPLAGVINGSITPMIWNTITLDNATGLSDFLSAFLPSNPPDDIRIAGSVLLNPPSVFPTPQGVGTISQKYTKVYSNMNINFPVKLGIQAGAWQDTVSLSDNKEFPKDLASDMKSARLTFSIDNGFPFALGFKVRVVGKNRRDTLIYLPKSGLAPYSIDAANINSDGRVTSVKRSIMKIQLTGDELVKFADAGAVWYQVLLNTSNNGQRVVVHTTDSVRVRASANVVYTVNRPK